MVFFGTPYHSAPRGRSRYPGCVWILLIDIPLMIFDDIFVDLCSTRKEVIGDSSRGKLSKAKQLTPPKTNIEPLWKRRNIYVNHQFWGSMLLFQSVSPEKDPGRILSCYDAIKKLELLSAINKLSACIISIDYGFLEIF